MKYFILLFSFLVLISCKETINKTDINQSVVQDYSALFSSEEKQKLTKKIINYEKLTTNQICVYTIDSLPKNENALYYATNLANKLGVGTKEKNNGLLILISKFDRKMAIATGFGTEKIITDKIAHSIIEKTIVPKFKDDLYFKGVNTGLDSIILKWQ